MAKTAKKVDLKGAENKTSDGKFKKDPALFGYREGQEITVNANRFMSLLSFAHQVVLKETEVKFEEQETFEKTLKTRKVMLSETGLQASAVMNFITGVHIENVEKGIAVHKDILEAESSKSVEAPKEEVNLTDLK